MPDAGRRFKVMKAKKVHRLRASLQVIFTEGDFRRLAADFAAREKAGFEGYALALCGLRGGPDKRSAAYLARSVHIPEDSDLIDHSSVSVTPSAEFMEAVLARAMERQSHVLEIHTHPGSSVPTFSAVDFDHGLDNGRFLGSCRSGFGMLVLGSKGFSILEYSGDDDRLLPPATATISLLTRSGLRNLFPPAKPPHSSEPLSHTVDRQVHIWGEECQRKISSAIVGLAGLGGTGSVLLQLLARAGVRKFVLCDPDVVEPSNLSRLPYAYEEDVGRTKVKVAAKHVKKVAPGTAVQVIGQRVQEAREKFRSCDVVFGCTDNDGARLALNEIALKYFIPCIDTGTEIFVDGGRIREMGGQVRVVVPGVTGCLECAEAIDHEEAAFCMLPAEEIALRARAGYVSGTSLTPAPAVITLNAMIASMAAQEFVDMMAGRDRNEAISYFLYDATVPHIERFAVDRNPDCPMCGCNGILGMGDLPKMARSRLKALTGNPDKSL